MDKKVILAIASVVVVLLLTYGYATLHDKKAPEIGNFIEGVTCSTSGNSVTVVSETNSKAVITFSSDGTKVVGFQFYETPTKINSRSLPIDLLNFVTKYGYLVDFAKQCFLDTSLKK